MVDAHYDVRSIWHERAHRMRCAALDCGHFLAAERRGETAAGSAPSSRHRADDALMLRSEGKHDGEPLGGDLDLAGGGAPCLEDRRSRVGFGPQVGQQQAAGAGPLRPQAGFGGGEEIAGGTLGLSGAVVASTM